MSLSTQTVSSSNIRLVKSISALSLWIGLIVFVWPTIVIIGQPPEQWAMWAERLFWIFGIPWFLIQAFVLGSATGYILLSSFILLGSLFGILRRDWNPIFRVLSLLVALGIIVWTFVPYHLPFSATHGHTMNMITAPLPWERGLRRSQSIGEIQPCSYKLLGWQEETLYYEATCGTKITTWQFTAGLANSAVKISDVPFPLSDETTPQSSLSKYTDAPSRQPGFVSPSGKWIAIVGYQIYGPEDVLVINN